MGRNRTTVRKLIRRELRHLHMLDPFHGAIQFVGFAVGTVRITARRGEVSPDLGDWWRFLPRLSSHGAE